VFIARDRLGIKPLYYSHANGAFLFASEVRALLSSGSIAPHVAADSLEAYLMFGAVAEPSTLVEGVFSLPPGHSIALQANAPSATSGRNAMGFFSGGAPDGFAPAEKFQGCGKTVAFVLEETVRDH